jgi:ABC-type multidrug transport system permease subunit
VLVVDHDDSFISQFLGQAGPGGDFGGMFDVQVVPLEEGRERIDAGEASALLIVPLGFGQAVLEGEPATLTLFTNPAQRILPAIVQEGLEMGVEAAFYLQRLLGGPLAEIAAGPEGGEEFFPDLDMARLAVEINNRMRDLDTVLFPPVIEIKTEVVAAASRTAGFNFGTLMIPGLVFMTLFFIVQGMSEDIWVEKEQGTLRRFLITPQPAWAFLGGKLGSGAVLMAGVSFLGIAVAALLFDVRLAQLPLAWIWATLSGTAMLSFFILLQLLAASRRAGNILTTVVLFPMMMIGGAFFPFEIMPDWMQQVGGWTPNGMAVIQLKEMFRARAEVAPVLTAAAGILVPAAVAFYAGLRILRGRFATG